MAFMQSHPAIYKTMQIHGDMSKLQEQDIMGQLASLTAMGYKWDPVLFKLRQMGNRHINADTPWIHGKVDALKHCGFWHQVCFNNFGFIPEGCLKCWKVCLTVKDYATCVRLREYQDTFDGPCKSGMEMRDYTPKHWGGYFYNDSFDEGRDCYERITKDLDKHLGKKNYHAILKRGCTEFEMIKGPSPFWHVSEEEEKLFRKIDSYVVLDNVHAAQSEMVRNNVMLKWVLWAHANGDMSYVPFNGGKKLFPDYVSYHEGDREQIKSDLALALAQVKGGLSTEDAIEFLQVAVGHANEKGLNLNSLGYVFGNWSSAPNPWKASMVENTPDDLKGDHDELT
jgi:hypothetical protein